MVRKVLLVVLVSALGSLGALGLAASAGAATTTQLLLSQGAAFSILGHSCGGIQEHAYVTGFGAGGYPAGAVYLQTRCGGSGRGGGYKTTTYTAWATVTWDWYGDTRSYAKLEAAPEVSTTFSAEDAYGDRIYNTQTAAYLETTSPPVVPPAAPTGVTASPSNIEVSEHLVLRFQVTWTPAAETAPLITASTITATPVGSSAPVLTSTVEGPGSATIVGPAQPSTTYRITVTNTDREGTSAASEPIEITSANADGEPPGGTPEAGPEFGRCVKVGGGGVFTSANCETESPTETGAYEWVRGAERRGFTTSIKPATAVKLEAAGKEKVTCTGESGSGQISGPKTVDATLITLTGCESLGGPCTTAGLHEGELQSAALEGKLGIVSSTERAGKETRRIGLLLHAAGGGAFLEYTCSISGAATIGGSVIVPVMAGKMSKASTLQFAATAGKQKPEAFEGGVREVLTNQLGEQVGLTLSAVQAFEEAIETNPLF